MALAAYISWRPNITVDRIMGGYLFGIFYIPLSAIKWHAQDINGNVRNRRMEFLACGIIELCNLVIRFWEHIRSTTMQLIFILHLQGLGGLILAVANGTLPTRSPLVLLYPSSQSKGGATPLLHIIDTILPVKDATLVKCYRFLVHQLTITTVEP